MPPAAHRLPRARRIRKRADFVRIQNGDAPRNAAPRPGSASAGAAPRLGSASAGAAPRLGSASAGAAAFSTARVTTRHLLLLLALRPNHDGAGDGPARLGVVASRKVGPAVARNRAKRLVREAFRRHPTIFPAGLDVVVVVRPGTHKAAQAEIDEEMRRAEPLVLRRAAELLEQLRVH